MANVVLGSCVKIFGVLSDRLQISLVSLTSSLSIFKYWELKRGWCIFFAGRIVVSRILIFVVLMLA